MMCPVAAMRQRLPWGLISEKSKYSIYALPAAIGLLALAFRLYGLGDKPFWLDEIATLRRATATVPDLVGDSLYNNHYPS